MPALFSGWARGTSGLPRRRLLAGLVAVAVPGVVATPIAGAQTQACTAANCPDGCCDGTGACRSLGSDAFGTRAPNGACVACEAGESCVSAGGGEPFCLGSGPTDPCEEAGLTACGETCVDLGHSRRNCGQCGHRCRRGKRCRNGKCKG